ncbi:UNVERIFIED_CONTAM: hypothetical protein Slati_1762800 [Sesamum latifolium]|uniref:Uncharacterized protein n=1 Tax=Sesamum latifolium TaxID=2727402 RepID=A0AAW2WXM6_9LAMI
MLPALAHAANHQALVAADSRLLADRVRTALPACRGLLHIGHVPYQPSARLPRSSASVRARAHYLPSAPQRPARCRDSSPHARHLPTLTADAKPARPPAVQPASTVTRPFLNLEASYHVPSTGPMPWHQHKSTVLPVCRLSHMPRADTRRYSLSSHMRMPAARDGTPFQGAYKPPPPSDVDALANVAVLLSFFPEVLCTNALFPPRTLLECLPSHSRSRFNTSAYVNDSGSAPQICCVLVHLMCISSCIFPMQ